MTVRPYTPDDEPMIRAWREHHARGVVEPILLPPLGIVVESGGAPVGAMWATEPVGYPVAELLFPVSRPGLSFREAMDVFQFAVESLKRLAGAGFEPRGVYRVFRCTATVPEARALMRWGFARESEKDLIPMICVMGCDASISGV